MDCAEELKYTGEIEEVAQKICQGSKGYLLAKHVDHMLSTILRYSEGDDELERVLHSFTLPNWIRRLEATHQVHDERGRQLSIRKHCYLLGYAVRSIGFLDYLGDEVTERYGESIGWMGASEWLEMASSVERVEVNTLYFDVSLLYCSLARDHENSRSDLLSLLAAELAIFNFAWGSLETIIRLIDPPKVPRSTKPRSSIIDRAIFYLKNEYEPARMLTFYDDTVAELRQTMKQLRYYSDLLRHFHLEELMGISGVGINVVRQIRNRFAHGTLTLPHPSGEEIPVLLDARLVELSTRIILFTIQMLLLAYLENEDFEIECREDEWGLMKPENVRLVLKTLHLERRQINESQLPLFE